MNTTKYFNFILLLVCIVLFSECRMDDEVDIEVTDPAQAIIGKWELVLLTRNMGNDEVKYKPTGYIEYFPDGSLQWYDYKKGKHIMLEATYWLEEFFGELENYIPKKGVTLHYQDLWIELKDGKQYCIYPDFQGCNSQSCVFFSHNRMGLTQSGCGAELAGSYSYIYKRIK